MLAVSQLTYYMYTLKPCILRRDSLGKGLGDDWSIQGRIGFLFLNKN